MVKIIHIRMQWRTLTAAEDDQQQEVQGGKEAFDVEASQSWHAVIQHLVPILTSQYLCLYTCLCVYVCVYMCEFAYIYVIYNWK